MSDEVFSIFNESFQTKKSTNEANNKGNVPTLKSDSNLRFNDDGTVTPIGGNSEIFFNVAGINMVDSENIYNALAEFQQNQAQGFVYSEGFLVPEPDNKFDPKALIVEFNNLKLGYFPKKQQSMLNQEIFKKITKIKIINLGFFETEQGVKAFCNCVL